MAKTRGEKISESLKLAYATGKRGRKSKFIPRVAYYAGYFDGEGYVGTTKTNKGAIALRCVIGSTDPVVLYELKEIYGGYLLTTNRNPEKWKRQWHWQISSRMAATFLRDVLPYLRIKKNQAILGLEYYRFYHRTNKVKIKFNYKMSKDRKSEIAEELKKLNHRGPKGVLIN